MKKLKLIKIIANSLLIISVLALNPIGASAEWKQDSTGWWYSDGSSYYLGWHQIAGKWYYFNNNTGYMAHDTIVSGYTIGSDGARIEITRKSYEELDKLPKKYNADMAKKDGDVVQVYGGIQYNLEKLDAFINNYKNKKVNLDDMVRITAYGEDGGPTIHDLIVGRTGIKLIEDNTRDEYSSEENRVITEYKVVDIYTRDNILGYRTYYIKTDQGEEMFLGNSDIH